MEEYLSPDILEEAFINKFAPILFVQKLLGTCRVDMRQRFVTPPSLGQKLFTLTLLITALFLNTDIIGFYVNVKQYPDLHLTMLMVLCIYILAFCCILIDVRCFNGEGNANFYIKLQKIDRLMNLDRSEVTDRINKMGYILVAIHILCVILGVSIALICKSAWLICYIYVQICHSIENSLCVQIIFYFIERLNFINSVMVNYIEGNPIRLNPRKGFIKNNIPMFYLASQSHNFVSNEIDVYLAVLLDGYAKYKYLFKLQIVMCLVKCTPLTLGGFYVLFMTKSRITPYSDQALVTISGVATITYDFIGIICLSLICEVFCKKLLITKRLCFKIMALNPEGPLRDKAKKMLIRTKQKATTFSLYDLVTMQGNTVFNLIKLLTTLVVTLLQFLYL